MQAAAVFSPAVGGYSVATPVSRFIASTRCSVSVMVSASRVTVRLSGSVTGFPDKASAYASRLPGSTGFSLSYTERTDRIQAFPFFST